MLVLFYFKLFSVFFLFVFMEFKAVEARGNFFKKAWNSIFTPKVRITPDQSMHEYLERITKLMIGELPKAMEKSAETFFSEIDKAGKNILNHAEDNVNRAGETLLNNAHIKAELVIQDTGRMVEGSIKRFDEIGEKFLLQFQDAGELIIDKSGTTFRATADHVLKQASNHGNILISAAGSQMSLTIKESGVEIRGIIDHASSELFKIFCKLPFHGRKFAEGVAAGLINEINEQLFGTTPFQKIIYKIDNHFRDNLTPNFFELLTFIQYQKELTPYEKSKIYKKLIDYVNTPEISFEKRKKLFLLIGSAIIEDRGLLFELNFINYQKDFKDEIIQYIPLEIVHAIMEDENEDEFYRQLGLPIPIQEQVTDIGLIFISLTGIIPYGYLECDGNEYPVQEYQELYDVIGQTYGYRYDLVTKKEYFRVPDLRDIFFRGVSQNRSAGSFQEDSTRMPRVKFETKSGGVHSHASMISGNHNHTMQEAGMHQHKVQNEGAHSHDITEGGEHSHKFYGAGKGWQNGGGPENKAEYWVHKETEKAGKHKHDILQSGSHSHNIDRNGGHVHVIQHSGDHGHQIMDGGAHAHEISGGDFETRPKNIAVKYLMKWRVGTFYKSEEPVKSMKIEAILKSNQQFIFFLTVVLYFVSSLLLFILICRK